LNARMAGIVKDGILPPMVLADFCLHALNTFQAHRYVDTWGLAEATTDVDTLIGQIMSQSGAQTQEAAAKKFVAKFRKGQLGSLVLDSFAEDAGAAGGEAA
jgi:hypothetical protein